MASPLVEAAVQSIELEAFSKQIPDLVPHSETLYGRFKKSATTIPVSNVTSAGGLARPSFRVPMRIQAGAGLAQGTGNADSFGRGSGSQWAGFAISPVFVFSVCEISFLARIATEGRKRGLFNVQAQELSNTFNQAMQGIEALCQGDGTGTLDTIPTTAVITNGTAAPPFISSIAGLNNAFQFTDQQVIQVFNPTGPVLRGTFTVAYTDPVTQTVFSTQALPVGTAAGDLLVVNGSPGTSGGSILGLRAWQNNSSTGTIGGLSRVNFPSRLQTPIINFSGGPISTSTPWRAQVLMGRALGPDNPIFKNLCWYCGPDQAFQIGNLYLQVLAARINDGKAQPDAAPDMTNKGWPKTWGMTELLVGYNALPGRLDLFTFDTWYLGELLPLELYDFGGGITIAPVPDVGTAAGSYLSSSMFIYVCAFNLANSAVRAGVTCQNAAIPTL
jgi:hypothetical protein